MIGRITILGGSSVYIPEFVLSLIGRNLNVQEIVLLGRPGRKLELVTQFCQRLLDKSGYPVRMIACTDVQEACKNAKYILNHIRVGGIEARFRDETLPLKYDMIGDDTLGAGGFANALRTLPVVFSMFEDIQEVNQDATVINLTNPMGILVEALSKHTQLRCIGVSDMPGVYIKKLAALLELSPADIRVDYAGLYHMGWIQDVKLDSRSRMSQVLELLDASPDEEFDKDIVELFRMIPTRNTSIYFHRGEVLKHQQSTSRFRAEILQEAEARILALYDDPLLKDIPELTRQRNAVWYEDAILPLIDALEGKEKRELVLCVRNDHCIRDLPEDASVEVPVAVCSKKLQARPVGSLPGFLKGMFIAAKESDRLTIEAARHRSYEYALQALVINPFVPSIQTARKFLDRIIKDEKLELH